MPGLYFSGTPEGYTN